LFNIHLPFIHAVVRGERVLCGVGDHTALSRRRTGAPSAASVSIVVVVVDFLINVCVIAHRTLTKSASIVPTNFVGVVGACFIATSSELKTVLTRLGDKLAAMARTGVSLAPTISPGERCRSCLLSRRDSCVVGCVSVPDSKSIRYRCVGRSGVGAAERRQRPARRCRGMSSTLLSAVYYCEF
jgi:hypothetical protein